MNELTIPTALTLEDALGVAHRLATASHTRPTPADLAADARAIAARIPSTTTTWCYEWIADTTRTGGPLTVDALADAWHVEAARRIASTPTPYASWHSTHGGMWVMWERARRRALVAGASPEDAITYANGEFDIPAETEPDLDARAIEIAKQRAKNLIGNYTTADPLAVRRNAVIGDWRPATPESDHAAGGAL